jgi:hypothetical protein
MQQWVGENISTILSFCRKKKLTKIGPLSRKTELGAQNQYGRVIYPSIGNFTWSKKKYTIQGQKSKNKPPEP